MLQVDDSSSPLHGENASEEIPSSVTFTKVEDDY